MTRDYRSRQNNRAIYLVAGQDPYQELIRQPMCKVRGGNLPAFLETLADLDFLDASNPFFHTDRALFSGGPVLRGDRIERGMFSPRPGVTILGDSGGFQLIKRPELFCGDDTRELMLRWLEDSADEAMTLDIPTAAIRPDSQFDSFDTALQVTVGSLEYFVRNRTPGAVRFLNVLQGRDRKEALRWYDTVAAFPFEGFAFGGAMRTDVPHLVDMLVRMHDDGILDKTRNRVHILGRATLRFGVLLSAIQRGLRARMGDPDFQITFDTSAPSNNMMLGVAHGYPALGTTEFKLTKFKPPSTFTLAGSTLPFPVKSSAISRRMTLGDLNEVGSTYRQSGWDNLGNRLIENHNLDSMLAAFDDANSVMEMEAQHAMELAPRPLVTACKATEEAFDRENPNKFLAAYLNDLRQCGV